MIDQKQVDNWGGCMNEDKVTLRDYILFAIMIALIVLAFSLSEASADSYYDFETGTMYNVLPNHGDGIHVETFNNRTLNSGSFHIPNNTDTGQSPNPNPQHQGYVPAPRHHQQPSHAPSQGFGQQYCGPNYNGFC